MTGKPEIKIKTVKVPAAPSRDSVYEVLNGVPADWLRRAFHMSLAKCQARLKGLRVIGVTASGVPLYDLGHAAERLVRPKMDLAEHLQDITVDDLPEKLREPFWNSKLKQQRYEKNAGELWRTEAVIHLFGSVLKDAKERLRLVNTLAENTLSMTPEQLQGLRKIVNDVQGEIYNQIITLESKTPSSIAELNKKFAQDDDDVDYISETAIGSDDDFEY